jgi:predicted nucleic acid-binding protein
MDLVISDTSPLINLAAVGLPNLLGELFGEILVPAAVAAEFDDLRQREPARFGAAGSLPAYVRVVDADPGRALIVSLDRGLDQGEIEALALAIERKADLILIDERGGTRAAIRWSLRTLGVLGVLLVAKDRGFIPLVAPVLERLRRDAGFWVAAPLQAHILREAGEV